MFNTHSDVPFLVFAPSPMLNVHARCPPSSPEQKSDKTSHIRAKTRPGTSNPVPAALSPTTTRHKRTIHHKTRHLVNCGGSSLHLFAEEGTGT